MDKIFVTRSSMPPMEEYMEEIKSLWESHWLTNMGEKHDKLEKQLENYLEVPQVSLFCNGHMALELAIQAMELKGEVITTPFTFASTTHAIVRNGLTPVFCDINPEDYTIDASKLEALITEKTTVIIPVHVYGNICNVEEIERIAKKYGLRVIYDAAHAFGVKYKNQGIGNFGDASMFSFHATKVFHSIEGGAVCYHDENYGLNLYRLKNFGIRDEVVVDSIGANAKMNEFQAAMGLCNLRHLEEEIEKREKVVECYRALLKDIKGINLARPQGDVQTNYAYFPVVFDEKEFGYTRDQVYEYLQKNGIFARKYFYPLTNTFLCYKEKFQVQELPVASYVSKRVLTLPLFADLPLTDVEKICGLIKNIVI